MRRIVRRQRAFRSVLAPGVLVLTDDGLLGKVRRLIDVSGVTFRTQIEVDDIDGGVALVSSQDIRLIYS